MAVATHLPSTQGSDRQSRADDRGPEPWSPRFSAAARAVAAACRASGMTAPGFRSPPAVDGVDRTLRRWPDGRCIVAVRAAGRHPEEVVSDLVEGVLAANRLRGEEAERARATLLGKLRVDGEAGRPTGGG